MLTETGFFSVLPPLISISLALITKEVYFSLFFGLLSGVAIYGIAAHESFLTAIMRMFDIICAKIADNAYMIVFLGLLWAVVVLVSKSGGSEAYGRRAEKMLKKRSSVCLAAVMLGLLIFIDDGFNCLTVGTVMKPVFDRRGVSREKLAYIIDSTAAPVCIIAPVSSWAVAVSSQISAENGFSVFLSTIPYNFYAILTLFTVLFVSVLGRDFGAMKNAEERALKSDFQMKNSENTAKNGRTFDLILPIFMLIVCSVAGMCYVGGGFSGVPFSEAIGVNPTAGLVLGAFAALVTAALLYLPRRIMKPREFIENTLEGIRSIVSPMLILVLSWSLGGVCREMLGTGVYIAGIIEKTSVACKFLPALVFVISALMSFSMGSSWGTFSILIPIVSMVCASEETAQMLIPTLGATLSGAAFGDHSSPISDTTILSSIGAECRHIDHVSTQLPYALTVATATALGYLLLGFYANLLAAFSLMLPLLITVILVRSMAFHRKT